MCLKRIEIFGFKSFPEKVELEISQGITAIIGPNGCGKSNIVDAIRWALGEQSIKSLRGTRMEDVIFNGTEQRKPLNYSEVSLTFENIHSNIQLEFSEINVTRRLFRSGESQYFINKTPCRLKEITELFYDTGIGKEAYSIIGQGKVEQVLSARPEDRRAIFEEAAGIHKYKNRKMETFRRLKETADNLLRLSDVLEELTSQLPPLEKQAAVAKEYKMYRERLRYLETGMLYNQIFKTARKKEDLGKKLDSFSLLSFEKYSLLNRLESDLSEKKLNLNKGEEENLETGEKLQEIQAEKNRKLTDIQLLWEKAGNLKRQMDETKVMEKELEESLQRIKDKELKCASSIKVIKDFTDRLEEELSAGEKELESVERTIKEYQGGTEKRLNKILQAINEKELGLKKDELEKNHLLRRCEEIIKEVESKKELVVSLKKEAVKVRQLISEKTRHKEAVENEAEELKKIYLSGEERIKLVSGDLKSLQTQLEKAKAQLEVLEGMEQKLEGYNEAVRAVLRAKENSPSFAQGVEGIVAELLEVNPRYEKAVEAALGSAAQHIVTKDEETAKQIIQYLKQSKRGRATFLPLSLVPPFKNKSQNLAGNGMIGWAEELVVFEDKYDNIFHKLLGNVLVTEDLDSALQFARKLKLKFKVVTLEGEIISPGGAITGGAYVRKSPGFLRRKNALKEIKKRVFDLENKVKILQKEYSGLEVQKEKVNAKLQESLEEGGSLAKEVEGLREVLDKLEKERKETSARLLNLEDENAKLNKIMERINTNSRDIEARLKELYSQEDNYKKEMENEQFELQERYLEKSEIEKNITRLKIELSSARKEADITQQNIEELKKDKQAAEIKYIKIKNKIKNLQNEEEKIKDVLNITKKELEALEKSEELLMDKYHRLKEKVTLLTGEITEKEYEARTIRRTIQDREKKKHQFEIEMTRLETELKNLHRRLNEEFNASYQEGTAYNIEISETEASREIAELRNKIHGLGNVNTGAIEEFERLKERIDFLMRQREDLREAKNTIHKVIKEIDDKMKNKFLECFNMIKTSFAAVFRDFFEGGRAYLKLADSDNVLESGIEIIAQPPGKKLQNLTLLSGGEKALTAIALLFAVLRVKPAPFCVLDEIEVSLDNLNLKRFINYLRTFSKKTQFIVITHRRQTMESAQVLYGVTMEESGVSKVLSMVLPSKKEQRVS